MHGPDMHLLLSIMSKNDSLFRLLFREKFKVLALEDQNVYDFGLPDQRPLAGRHDRKQSLTRVKGNVTSQDSIFKDMAPFDTFLSHLLPQEVGLTRSGN